MVDNLLYAAEAGDILFFHGQSVEDRFIQLWTSSPFSHVGIAVGPAEVVEALNNGIEKNPMQPPANIFKLREHSTDYDTQDLAVALRWLDSMVGQKYGWSDVASAAALFNHVIYAVKPGFYDCSALACEFLIKAGGIDLGALGSDPHLATPASLAKQLNISG